MDHGLSTFDEKLSTRAESRSDSDFAKIHARARINNNALANHRTGETLVDLALPFTVDELSSYVDNRTLGLADKSCDWIRHSAEVFWRTTLGVISRQTIKRLRKEALGRYTSLWGHSKTLTFAKSFLKYLTRTRLDTRYGAFEPNANDDILSALGYCCWYGVKYAVDRPRIIFF